MTIEEQSHQLFSDIIEHCRNGTPITFEGEVFSVGTGPLLYGSDGEMFLDFTGDCGLLGYGHPLVLKNYLQKALKANSPINENRYKIQTESLFSDIIGQEVFLSYPCQNEPKVTFGRLSHFKELKKGLNEFGSVSLTKTFSQAISLSLKPSYCQFDYGELINILKFLKNGQFFGQSNLIDNRELQIRQELGELPIVKGVKGLIVELKYLPQSEKLLIDKRTNHLFFPLSFNETILNLLKSELK